MNHWAGSSPARAPGAGGPSTRQLQKPAIPGRVAVAGSRSLPQAAIPLIDAVCKSIIADGHSIVVGCATGVDAAVLNANLPIDKISCLAAFSQGGKGACNASDVIAVSNFAERGGSVSWLAGGPLIVPLKNRLVNRTKAVINEASRGCVLFFSTPESRGTLLAARLAMKAGLSIWAFNFNVPLDLLPPISIDGTWVKPNQFVNGIWSNAVIWQPKIF